MKENDKISQLFQDNQHKLDEMPSTLAWDRLEGRLETRESHQKSFTFRRMAVAAAVIIALSMVALWTYINPLNHANIMSDTTAMFEQKQLPSEIIASNAPAPARPILMSHRERSKYLTELDNVRINTKPVLADKTKKSTNVAPKVRPKPISPPAPPIAKVTTPIASADIEKAKEATPEASPITTPATVQTHPPVDIQTFRPVASEGSKEAKSNNVVVYQPNQQGGQTYSTTTATEAETLEKNRTNDKITLRAASSETPQSPPSPKADIVMDEAPSKKSAKTAKTKHSSRTRDKRDAKDNITLGTRSATKQTTTIQADSYEIPSEEGIDKFDWLLGKWADEEDNSFEEWYRTNNDTIEGKGYFVVDVDTTFTQSMRIVERNSEVYFMVNGQLVEGRFLLESYNNRSAIFKDDVVKDSKIILKNDADNTLSIIIDNANTRKERKRKRRTLKRIRKNNE